ncbi:MAG: alpha/beta hydrolase-fold protein [Bacillota bacterium]|nr:alpha/beta hydrolase-fold protein [Bacillota bacterium]
MKKIIAFLLCIVLTASMFCMSANAANTSTTITFNITLPYALVSDAHLSFGGSINSWAASDSAWYATKVSDKSYTLTKTLDSSSVGTTISYKWTVQVDGESSSGWLHPETTATGGYVENRSYTIKSGANIVNDTVGGFQNFSSSGSSGAESSVTGGTLDIVTLTMSQFSDNRTRNIRIWLPNGYNSKDTSKKYPVVYMHDGQNCFDWVTSFSGEWKADESVTNFIQKDGYGGCILVGVDNGGTQRFSELSPSGWTTSALGKNYITSQTGDLYAAFIVNTVIPYVNSHYNTKTGNANTMIAGSSMGGVMSFYMATKYPSVFGAAMVFSPALQLFDDNSTSNYISSLDSSHMRQPKLYIYAGGKLPADLNGSDAGTAYDETLITPYVNFLNSKLTANGYSATKIQTKIDLSQTHSESAWSVYFPIAFQWLWLTSNETYVVGDADNNGTVTLKDTTILQKYLAKLISLSDIEILSADVDESKTVNLKDVTAIQKYLANINTGYDIGNTFFSA